MKLAVVSGCNRGIGLELCLQLKNKDYRVIGLCRKSSAALVRLEIDVIENVDVSDSTRLREVADQLENNSIDLLINNAGIMEKGSLDDFNFEGMLNQFKVNAVAPLKVFSAFRHKFKNQSKLAVITSRMGSISDNASGGAYGYRMSKTAVNAAFKSLAIDLAKTDPEIFVGIIHPGYVRTDMTQLNGLIDAGESASGILDQIEKLNQTTSGNFYHSNGELLGW